MMNLHAKKICGRTILEVYAKQEGKLANKIDDLKSKREELLSTKNNNGEN